MVAIVGENAQYAGAMPSPVDATSGAHYVSIISSGRLCLALGPFEAHAAALPWVDAVREFVKERDGRGWTYAYGTSRVEDRDTAPIGKLNKALGL